MYDGECRDTFSSFNSLATRIAVARDSTSSFFDSTPRELCAVPIRLGLYVCIAVRFFRIVLNHLCFPSFRQDFYLKNSSLLIPVNAPNGTLLLKRIRSAMKKR